MKKTFLLLAAALAFTACQFHEEEAPAPGSHSILFHALADTPTKTAFGQGENGTYPTYWTTNDSQVKLALNYTEAQDAAVSPSADGTTATFVAVLNPDATTAPYVFNALSPASAVKALSPSRRAWSVDIPAVQTPLAGSVDEAAMLLWARSAEASVLPDEMSLTFKHLTAYGLLTLKNLDITGSAVQRVEITATTPLAGSWYFGPEDGSLTENGASSTLTLNTSATENIWFACAPVDVSNEILVFSVYTANAVYVKEVSMPQNRSFQSGRVARMSVDFAGIEPVSGASGDFELVTDASVLKAGDQIIIANQDGDHGLGAKNTGGTTPYRQAVAITVSNGIVTNAGDATILTLVAGSTSGTWAFQAPDGYLCTTSTKNSLSTENTITDASSWAISITASGDATVEAQSGTYNLLRYNYNNGSYSRFSAYASTSSIKNPVAIYRKGSSAISPDEDPLTAQTEYGYYFGNDTRTYVAGTDQYAREYDPNGCVTFVLLNTEGNEQVEITGYHPSLVKGDAVTLTVSHRQGTVSIFQGSRPLQVVKEDGAKVWLGDGSGNGIILKK